MTAQNHTWLAAPDQPIIRWQDWLLGLLGFLTFAGAVAGIGRLVMGMQATTQLNDVYSWGIWIGFDFGLIALAGAGFTMAAVAGVDPALRIQVRALGASPRQTAWAILDETRVGVIAAVVAGFGGIISEVGAVMIVGGNIEGRTRVLTTAIVLETNKGNFELAMALGIVLLTIAFGTNFIILHLQGRSLEP